MPLTSNVRPLVNRVEILARTIEARRTAAVVQARCLRSAINSVAHSVQPGWPIAHVCSTREPSLRQSPKARVCSTEVPSLKQSTKAHGTRAGARSASPRSCVTLPLRGVGALGHAVEFKLMAVATVVPSSVRPNPSVEGTHNGGARLLASEALAAPLCAPHVKR